MSLILGLDPGTTETGYAYWDGSKTQGTGIVENEKILPLLASTWAEHVGIEMIASYGMPVGKEVFETCVWIGRYLQHLVTWGRPDGTLIYRREVKQFLCNSVKAKDANVWQAIVDKHGPVGTKAAPGPLYGVKSHARAALGVALTLEARLSGKA